MLRPLFAFACASAMALGRGPAEADALVPSYVTVVGYAWAVAALFACASGTLRGYRFAP